MIQARHRRGRRRLLTRRQQRPAIMEWPHPVWSPAP